MGYALIWIESLATALLFVALFTALSGRLKRRLWQIVWSIMAALLPFFIFISATVLGYILHNNHMESSWLFGYTLSLTFSAYSALYYLSTTDCEDAEMPQSRGPGHVADLPLHLYWS